MPLLSDAKMAYIGTNPVSKMYIGSRLVYDATKPKLNISKAMITSAAGAQVQFYCPSPVTITVSSYLSGKFNTITPTYTSGGYGYFDIYPNTFPSSGSYIGYVYVTNSVSGSTSKILIAVGSSSTKNQIRVITGGSFTHSTLGSIFYFQGYTFDDYGHLCCLFRTWDSYAAGAIIPAGQTDFSNGIYVYGLLDNIETDTPSVISTAAQSLSYVDVHHAISGTLNGYGDFVGCVNFGSGATSAGYAFKGTSQRYSLAVDVNDFSSGREDFGYTNDTPLASNGEYYSFADATSVSGVSMTYIDS